MAVTIIGMGRSGSSLTARLLNISGLYLGPADDMMEANDWNEKGFWEHLGIYNINLRLLETFGGTWDVPPIFPSGWVTSESVRPLREEALALLETMRGRVLWGWKEPRTTLTLPFWRAVVPDLRFVVCLRNPLDVYSSLLRLRHPSSFAGTMALWRCYTELALRQTRPEERVIVSYEDYFHDYRKALEPVWAFLGLDLVATGTPEDQALSDFIEPGLQHSQHTLQDVLAHPCIPRAIKQLYERLLEDREQLETELSAASFSDTDAGSYDCGMVALLQTIDEEKGPSAYKEENVVDLLEAQEVHARQLEEQLAAAYRTVEAQEVHARQLEEQLAAAYRTVEAQEVHARQLEELKTHTANLQTALGEADWQIDRMKSSRGIRLILMARAARATLGHKNPLAFAQRVALWMTGKQGNPSGHV